MINDDIENKDFIKKISNLDSRIILIQNSKNLGAGLARNKGIDISQGEYLCFLDSDDTMTDNRIAVLKDKLKSAVLVSNDLNLMNERGAIFEKTIWKERLPEDYSFDYNFLKSF